ncbi:cell division control protein 42 homolog [Harmonia axyridis]|uniref:cell division control protein 42 homolog n=1 Tax=Harmonia axyridis TaxID=115357 RepID=UPI001E279273|nr:cell division control protein 42 homolog [Harmonia axyridis]
MPPQSNVTLHCYNKEPLLRQQRTISFTCGSKKKKSKDEKEEKKKNKIKCVLVGDDAVGKTSLIASYSAHSFPYEYVPTAYDKYNVEVQVDGKPIAMELCDTAGQDELDPLRSLCYPDSDIFLLCFSTVDPSTFVSASTRWANELSKRDGAIVLVGTKSDLSTNPEVVKRLRSDGQRPISSGEAINLAELLNAPYIETSARTGMFVKEAFDLAITIALRNQKKARRKFWKKLLWCC